MHPLFDLKGNQEAEGPGKETVGVAVVIGGPGPTLQASGPLGTVPACL